MRPTSWRGSRGAADNPAGRPAPAGGQSRGRLRTIAPAMSRALQNGAVHQGSIRGRPAASGAPQRGCRRLQRAVAMVSRWPRKRILMRPRALRCFGCSPWPWTRIGRQASGALGGATRFTNSRLRCSWSATWEAFKPPLLSSMGALTSRRGAGPSRKSTRSQRGPSSPCAGKALSASTMTYGAGTPAMSTRQPRPPHEVMR